jgi:hypothetical protein
MGSHGHQIETGVIDLNLTFETPTASPLTLVILACHKSAVTISKDDYELHHLAININSFFVLF